jgi:hypothetical protein
MQPGMTHRTRVLRPLVSLAVLALLAATACGGGEADPGTASSDSELFLPPMTMNIENLVVSPGDSYVDVFYRTPAGPVSTVLAVGIGPSPGVGTVLSTLTDAATISHAFVVRGLSACSNYWLTISWGGTRYGSRRFSTTAANLDTFEVTQSDFNQARVHVRTSAPSPVTLYLSQNQDMKTDPDWMTDMSNPGGLEHNYYFALNGPKYIVYASQACAGWSVVWSTIDWWPGSYGGGFSSASSGEDVPRDTGVSYMNDIQGIAHGGGYWYVSNHYGIHKIPQWADMEAPPAHPSAGIPGELYLESDHIGDVDFYGGYLFAPLEFRSGMSTSPKVVFYDADLSYLGYTLITEGATPEIPWLAVNPIDGLLYTSVFNLNADPGRQVRAYQINRDPSGVPVSLSHDPSHDVLLRDEYGTPISVPRVQGGAFSPMGHLYLVSDGKDGDWGGVMAFDLSTGRRKARIPISYDQNGTFRQELQGIDLYDATGSYAWGITGQVHVMMQNWRSSSAWFKHFETPSPAPAWWL